MKQNGSNIHLQSGRNGLFSGYPKKTEIFQTETKNLKLISCGMG